MTRKDAVVLASRTLALLLTVWALTEASYLPASLHSFLRYIDQGPGASTAVQYWRHYYLITLSFIATRMVGFALLAMWLFKGGREVEELLSPRTPQENAVEN
jgi:hypothetical protein